MGQQGSHNYILKKGRDKEERRATVSDTSGLFLTSEPRCYSSNLLQLYTVSVSVSTSRLISWAPRCLIFPSKLCGLIDSQRKGDSFPVIRHKKAVKPERLAFIFSALAPALFLSVPILHAYSSGVQSMGNPSLHHHRHPDGSSQAFHCLLHSGECVSCHQLSQPPRHKSVGIH